MRRRNYVENWELPAAVAWESLRARYFERMGPHYEAKALECKQLSEHYFRRLQEER